MAINRYGISGQVSGKVGNLVFYIRHGKNYVKTLATRKKLLRTSKIQENNYSIFRTVQKHVVRLLPIIRLGFKSKAIGKSEYNAALSYNMKNAIIIEQNEVKLNYQKLTISSGIENPVTNTKIYFNNKLKTIKISWELDKLLLDKNLYHSYQTVVIIYPDDLESTKIEHLLYANSIYSRNQEIEFKHENLKGKYHVYLSFFPTNGTDICTNSIYLGEINLD